MQRLAILLLLSICVGHGQGCLAEGEVETWRSRIGEGASCDPVEQTCWPELDRQRMAAAHLALLDAGSGPMEQRTQALCMASGNLGALSHKLAPEQGAWLAEYQMNLCGAMNLDEPALAAAAAALVETILVPLEGAYLSAYMEPVRDDFERFAASEEGAWSAAWGAHAIPISSSWPIGVQNAVRTMGDTGPIGMTYVQMLVTGGVFDRDYARANAELFGGQTDLTEQERVDRIVDDAVGRAAWIGLASGAATAVPVVGIAISLGVRTQLMIVLQAEVTLRIAEARGLDPRDEDTVMMAIASAITGGMLPSPLDGVAATAGEQAVFRTLGIRLAWAAVTKLSQQLAIDLARQGVGRVVLGLLGTATAGLVSGAAGAAIEAAMMVGYGHRTDGIVLEYRRLRT